MIVLQKKKKSFYSKSVRKTEFYRHKRIIAYIVSDEVPKMALIV